MGSRAFFYGILIFFALESLWIACSAMYPMAFDEDFHLGIIKVYSHQWLPFLSGQPEGAAQFGALQHDPSYLYHYLMSFPYRLMTAVTDSQTAQVIGLRILNIGLATVGVALFRRVLRRVGTSPALAHTALAVFVLVPIMPLLAGQINYDNLLLPLVAALFLSTFRVYTGLQKRQIDLPALASLLVVCLLASLVKYPFLPIAAAVMVFLTIMFWRAFRGRWPKARRTLVGAYRGLGNGMRVALIGAVVISSALWIQRYGVNVVQYHTPVPSCDAVLTEDDCEAYGPWFRNYELAKVKGDVDANPLSYTWQWLQALHYRMFFAVNGPSDSYRNYPPLPLPGAAAIAVLMSGIVALALYWRSIFRARPLLVVLGAAVLLYCGVLWVEDYSQYLETGQPVAINGRYLLPVLLPLAAVLGRALSVALAKHRPLKSLFAVAVIVLFLQGGGVFTFISRSDDAWYWPNAAVRHVNNGARRMLAPVIIEGSKYY